MSVTKPRLENTDPLRLTAAKQARKAEARRRLGYQRGAHLEWLFNNRKIGKAQYLAGCRVRALFAENLGQLKSLDLSNDRVDGGKPDRDYLLVSASGAEKMLTQLGQRLGPDLAFVLFRVVGMGCSVQEVAAYFSDRETEGAADRASKDYCGRLLKDGLNHAAFFFGLATRAQGSRLAARIDFACVSGMSTTKDEFAD